MSFTAIFGNPTGHRTFVVKTENVRTGKAGETKAELVFGAYGWSLRFEGYFTWSLDVLTGLSRHSRGGYVRQRFPLDAGRVDATNMKDVVDAALLAVLRGEVSR